MKFIRVIKSNSSYISSSMVEQSIENYEETGKVDEILLQLKPRFIGQGYGYKSDKKWEDMAMDEVIYIPEGGYTKGTNGTNIPESFYTKEDFIKIQEYEGGEPRAKILFEDVDWQDPNTLSEEYDWRTDYNESGSEAPEDFEPQYDEEGRYISKK